MIKYTLTVDEANLLDDISDIQYGELRDVEIDGDGRATIVRDLTSQQRELVELIRTNGIASFRTIKIILGQPTFAEVTGVTPRGNYPCVETHKLN